MSKGLAMGSRTMAALLIAVLAVSAAPVMAEGLFGAIAFSPSTGKAGTAWNNDSADLAETEAYLQCRSEDCYTAVVSQQCAAIAVGDGHGMGFASDASSAAVAETALAKCANFTSNCEVTASFCNDGY